MKFLLCALSMFLFACHANVQNVDQLKLERDDGSLMRDAAVDSNVKMYLCQGEHQAYSIDPLGPLEVLESIVLQENVKSELEPLSLQRILFLRDPDSSFSERKKELYFSWPEIISGKSVLYANYSHRIFDSKKKTIYGTLINRSVAHDLDNRYWFLPMNSIFAQSLNSGDEMSNTYPYHRLEDVDPDHIQEITFELGLQGEVNLAKKLQFHLAGPLPNLQLIEMGGINSMNAQSPEEFIKAVFKDGLLLRKSKIENPTSRNLVVNYRVKSPSFPIVLQSYIQKTHTAKWLPVNMPLDCPGPEFYKSEGIFQVKTLTISHSSGEQEVKRVHENSWEHFTLKPRDTVTLEWRVQPGVDTARVLETGVKTRDSQENFKVSFTLPEFGNQSIDQDVQGQTVRRTQKASFIGARVQGSLDFEMSYGHSFSMENTSENLEQDLRPIENTSSKIHFQIGQIHSGAKDYKHQGFFK